MSTSSSTTVSASSSTHELASDYLPPPVNTLKRHLFASDYSTPDTSTGESIPDESASNERPTKRLKIPRVHIQVNLGSLTSPRSNYVGWRPPLPVVTETQAINELRVFWNNEDPPQQEEFNIWTLEAFTVYRVKTHYKSKHPSNELTSIHYLQVERGFSNLLFDGVLTVCGEKRLVRGVPFNCVTVNGYGDEEQDDITLCIQSKLGQKADVWYQLGTSSSEYARYHKPYLWIARFGKYFAEWVAKTRKTATLYSFHSQFFSCLSQKYKDSPKFKTWYSQYGSQDFRQALCANVGYLFKECWSLDKVLTTYPIWNEVDPQRLNALVKQPIVHHKTVVTPFVYECFQNTAFASQLQICDSTPGLTLKHQSRRAELGLTPGGCKPTTFPEALRPVTGTFRQGDVVCVETDETSRWKRSIESRWYAYVQDTRTSRSGMQKLDVIWLYEPRDTTLRCAYYPWKNELFFSDNCSCGKDALSASDVLSKVDVRWFVDDPEAQISFFVRKKFRTEPELGAYDFVQLKKSDFKCPCIRDYLSEMDQIQDDYKIGDTVLYRKTIEGDDILEPAKILQFLDETVLLQRFYRCRRDLGDMQARPNQIVPASASETYAAEPCKVVRKCDIAVFQSIQDVRLPYDLDGAGDFWFIIDGSNPAEAACSLGPGKSDQASKLRGLSIFCGGGNFDRGLEEGSGVAFKWAVDMDAHALHTYRANLETPDQTHLWHGSVNDYLAKAVQGSKDGGVATIGDVEMIAAGSPCPGFSVMQQNKQSDQSLRNCSLIASVCAYVDLYMPLYLVLENVLGMANNSNAEKKENVFSQVLCCLVAMGYQVQQFLMDPGHYGSCQSRSRIFIVATAPSLHNLNRPPQTHSSTELEKLSRSIGYSSNGLPFGKRKSDVCPFPFLSAKNAIHSLPDIAEGHVQTCIPFPDHRLCSLADHRALLSCVPRWPFGQGFVQAHSMGLIPQRLVDGYAWRNKNRADPKGKSWSRIYPNRLVGCITTRCQPHDAFGGRTIHYDQPRALTVMEVRRVQSFPDNEVIIGNPSQQWKIVGNSVDRKVAFALGLRLAEAWDKSNRGRPSAIDAAPAVNSLDTDPTTAASISLGMVSDNATENPDRLVQQQLISTSSSPQVVNSASEAVMTDVQDQPQAINNGSADEVVKDSTEPMDNSTTEVIVIDDSDEAIETEEPGAHNDTKDLMLRRRIVAPGSQTLDQCTRRNMRGSSARLIVPVNFAARPERANTSFL